MRKSTNLSLRSNPPKLGPISLNSTKRRFEHKKITKENIQLLLRLQSKSSNYSVKEFNKDRKRKEDIIKNISEFPFKKTHSYKRQLRRSKESKESIEISKTITHFLPKADNNRVWTTINHRNESQMLSHDTDDSKEEIKIEYHK